MKYEDFSSLVQLGVGLHAGTALLQIYGEIGIQPLVRTLDRIRESVKERNVAEITIEEDIEKLEADFAIFRIQLFNEFKKYVVINFVVSAVLIAILIVISYKSACQLSSSLSVVFTALSIVPAPAGPGILWLDASREMRPLKKRADRLEQAALRRS